MKTVLTIAASDPSGGAGIQADLRAICAHDLYGMAVPTALTIQNTLGVTGVHVPPVEILAAQLRSVLSDITPDAVGPCTLDHVLATRHLKAQLPEDFAAFRPVSLSRKIRGESRITIVGCM